MKARAIYHETDPNDDGRIVHAIDHDGGGFVVSSKAVGVAVQNFLNNATTSDISTLHNHLMYAFKDRWNSQRTDDDVKRDMMEAHAEGWHDEIPREFCPYCEGK